MLKIVIISIITIILSIILKQKSPEFSLMISVGGSILIVVLCYDYFMEILSYLEFFNSKISADSVIFKMALKVIVIGYLTEFTSDLACDFGNSIIATKVIFGGKVIICFTVIPLIKELFLLLFSFL